MKKFFTIWGGKNHLPLLRKRTLATLAALLCMMALMPMTARAETINTVISSEQLNKTSTIYVGEVVVDGVSEIKFLYSGDITLNNTLLQNLLDGLNGMADGDYAALLAAYEANGYFVLPEQRLALCSNPDLIAAMDANWSSAQYVGTLYYADKSVVSEINSNLYDLDAGFKAVLDAKTAQRIEDIENIIDEPKCIVTHLGATSTENVYYTVENGLIIKHVDTYITYSSEATTVIYTKVELETLMTETPLTFEAVEAGTITVNLDEGATLEAIQYKLNDAEWTDVTWGEAIDLDAHDVISFRGDNGTCYINDDDLEIWAGFHFECSNPCYVYGNMMSLIDEDDFATNTTLTEPFTFFHLFQTSDYEPNNTILNHPTKDIVLPATTLTANCYDGLFADCQGITRATELPATTLADWCYCMMFAGTGITTAPALPATTLAEACYSDIFMNCTNLTTAPDLPATTLAVGCYSTMFGGCTSLNYVKCLATDISADYSTVGWMYDVAPTGTFVKAAGMTGWTTGENGIPEGWTVETIDVFTTDGDWNVAANWSGNAVPADGSNVVIAANATIPANYVANAGEVSLNTGATLTLADGGQLYHNNAGVKATVQKTIEAYTPNTKDGWHLIGHSFADNGAIAEMDNLLANDYDLYYYDEPTHYWKNHKNTANNFTELEAAKGYLYANSQAQTIGLKGTLETANATVNVPLSYTEGINLAGFNLVGNPFAHNVTTYTGTNVADGCYVMNETKDDLTVSEISAANPLKPGEGFFVKATAENASITFNSGAKGETAKTGRINLELRENGKLIDRLIVKRGGEPLEKLTLRENSTKLYATEDAQDYAVVVAEGNEQDVNFKPEKDGTYTLNVNVENMDLDYLHLIDNLTGADIDLLHPEAVIAGKDPQSHTPMYTFTAKTTDYANRFRLVFSASGDADGDNVDAPFAYISNGNIVITADARGASLQVIDMMGRVVCSTDVARNVSTYGMAKGVYVLRLINGSDVKTQKIVMR